MTLFRRRTPDERGASLVEFALILPVFMMLVLGLFTGGIAYNQQLQLTHAAREGARFGGTFAADESNWENRVRDIIRERSVGELTDDRICVALVSGSPGAVVDNKIHRGSNSGALNSGPCFNDGGDDDGLRVQVLTRRPATIEVLLFSMNINLTADAVAKHEDRDA